ncbi:MAG: hypothetical protein HZC38_12435 [Chloroflexi bacterium]|nr:hypothetical protein [Chloroflexota bacterium]
MKRHAFYWLPLLTLSFILASIAIFWTTSSAEAQCGSQASSCKNCHEVQGKKPINNDGKAWHTSHAFGDFCQFCHSGNVQSMNPTEAHTDMSKPLADAKLSCSACHQKDYVEKAQVYAAALGVTLKVNNGTTPTPLPTATPTIISANTSSGQSSAPRQVATLPPQNAEMLIGSGALVSHNFGWVHFSFKETKAIKGEFPVDVADLIPDLTRLKPHARQSLRRLLRKPEAAAEVLTALDKLNSDDSSEKKS